MITCPDGDRNRDSDHIRVLVINGWDRGHDRDDDHIHIREQIRDLDHDLNPALPPTIQENRDKLKSLRKENAKYKAEEEKRRFDKSKLKKKQDEKVCSEHLATDAIAAKLKSHLCASKSVNQFGPLDSSTKVDGTRPKTLQKGDSKSKSNSPAKRNRTEKSHPVTANPKHHKTGPPITGAGLMNSSKMLQK